jgi:hypothetical protein
MRRELSFVQVVAAATLGVALIGAVAYAPKEAIIKQRDAALAHESRKFDAISFTSLAAWSTADKTIEQGEFAFVRRVEITDLSGPRFVVKIVMTPVLDPSKRDSVVLERLVADAR